MISDKYQARYNALRKQFRTEGFGTLANTRAAMKEVYEEWKQELFERYGVASANTNNDVLTFMEDIADENVSYEYMEQQFCRMMLIIKASHATKLPT